MTFSVEEINGQLKTFEQVHFLTDTKILCGQSEMQGPGQRSPGGKAKQRYHVLKVTDYNLAQPGWSQVSRQQLNESPQKVKPKQQYPLPVRIVKEKQPPKRETDRDGQKRRSPQHSTSLGKAPAEVAALSRSQLQFDFDVKERAAIAKEGAKANSNAASQRSTSQFKTKSRPSKGLDESNALSRSHLQLSVQKLSQSTRQRQQNSCESIYQTFGQHALQPKGTGSTVPNHTFNTVLEAQSARKKHLEVKVVKHGGSQSKLNMDLAHTSGPSGQSSPKECATSTRIQDVGPSPTERSPQKMQPASSKESTPRKSKRTKEKEMELKNAMMVVHHIPRQTERKFERLGKTRLSAEKEEKTTLSALRHTRTLLPEEPPTACDPTPLPKIDMMQFADRKLDSQMRSPQARQLPKQQIEEERARKHSMMSSSPEKDQHGQRSRERAVTVVFKKGQAAESGGPPRSSCQHSSAGDLLSHIRLMNSNESAHQPQREPSAHQQNESSAENSGQPRRSTNRSAIISKINLSALTDIYQKDRKAAKDQRSHSRKQQLAGKSPPRSKLQLLKAGMTGMNVNEARLEMRSNGLLRQSAADASPGHFDHQALSTGSNEAKKNERVGHGLLARQDNFPIYQNQTLYDRARPNLIQVEHGQHLHTANRSLVDHAQNMESLESSEFYPNQEVLMPSQPVFDQDQISFQIANNMKAGAKNGLDGREAAALRLRPDARIDGPSNAQQESGGRELAGLEHRIENRIKRELLQTSEGMKTIYQFDADDRNNGPSGSRALIVTSSHDEDVPLTKIDSAVFETSQDPSMRARPYEALISAGQIPNPITPYMRSFSNGHDANEQAQPPSENTLLRAATQSQQDLKKDSRGLSKTKHAHSKAALNQFGYSISTKNSKEYISQQRQQNTLNFNFGVEGRKSSQKMPTTSPQELLMNNSSSRHSRYVSPRLVQFGFEPGVSDSATPNIFTNANSTPGRTSRQAGNSPSSFGIAHIKIRQPSRRSGTRRDADYGSHNINVQPPSQGKTQPTAKERMSKDISAHEFKISEQESALTKTVELSPGVASPGLTNQHSSPFLLRDRQHRPALGTGAPKGRADELGGAALESFSRSSRSNVVVFSKVPAHAHRSQVSESYDYHPDQAAVHGRGSGYSSALGKYPQSLPFSPARPRDAVTESLLQKELVSTFDKIKISREQIQELKRLARLRKQQNHQRSPIDVDKIKQYSQVYLGSLQQCDDYTFGMPTKPAQAARTTSHDRVASRSSLALQTEADRFRHNFDFFADIFNDRAHFLPSQRHRSGCRQSIFIPSGLPQVSSMASFKNLKTNHNAFHTPTKLKKKSNDKPQQSQITTRPRNQHKRNVLSLPSVHTKALASPTKSNEPTSRRATPEQPRSPSREDLRQTKLMLEISQRAFNSRQLSSRHLEGEEPPDEELQLPKIIRVHKNQDNSVQVSRFASSLGIVQSQKQHQPHDRFKLLQYRSREQAEEEMNIEKLLAEQLKKKKQRLQRKMEGRRAERSLKSQIHLAQPPNLHADERLTWAESLRTEQEEMEKAHIHDIRQNSKSAMASIEHQKALAEVEAFKNSFLLNFKNKPGRNKVLHTSLNNSSLLDVKQSHEQLVPLEGGPADVKPSQRAKEILQQSKEKRKRIHANLSVQSIGYNPNRTHIEDIMQERLEVSFSMIDRATGIEVAKRDKANSPMLGVVDSFARLFPGITQQKMEKVQAPGQGEEYYNAINDHAQRMRKFIDTSIRQTSRRLSRTDIESALLSSAAAGTVLTRPADNQVTPRQLQRQRNGDQGSLLDVQSVQQDGASPSATAEADSGLLPSRRQLEARSLNPMKLPGAAISSQLKLQGHKYPGADQGRHPKANLDLETLHERSFLQIKHSPAKGSLGSATKAEAAQGSQRRIVGQEMPRFRADSAHKKVIRWAERDKLRAIQKLKEQSDKFKIQRSVIATDCYR